jgi:hypothetical protein
VGPKGFFPIGKAVGVWSCPFLSVYLVQRSRMWSNTSPPISLHSLLLNHEWEYRYTPLFSPVLSPECILLQAIYPVHAWDVSLICNTLQWLVQVRPDMFLVLRLLIPFSQALYVRCLSCRLHTFEAQFHHRGSQHWICGR